MKITHVFNNMIQRSVGLAPELKKDDGTHERVVPFADLIPAEMKNKVGTYKITIEFEENK